MGREPISKKEGNHVDLQEFGRGAHLVAVVMVVGHRQRAPPAPPPTREKCAAART